ncbi:SDR family NAD(P)-dependent oxidoreductase [Microbacterium soli]|uniref:SDR family oxidoreductase n=1 Tax=Microbacterium soli TaxID=446075 RepID=A0ABP7N926_9MICO
MSMSGRTALLAGATSAAGLAAAAALVDAGARVITTGRSAERLKPLADVGARIEVADATSFTDMSALARRIGAVDLVLPLVGGWRGGGGLAGQSDEDLDALLPSFQAVRATSRAFDASIRASDAGRFAMVSSTAVERPLAGGANYTSIKAAGEAWTLAVAQGYAKAARDSDRPLRAASVILRAEGALDPDALARAVIGLWDADATESNGTIRLL